MEQVMNFLVMEQQPKLEARVSRDCAGFNAFLLVIGESDIPARGQRIVIGTMLVPGEYRKDPVKLAPTFAEQIRRIIDDLARLGAVLRVEDNHMGGRNPFLPTDFVEILRLGLLALGDDKDTWVGRSSAFLAGQLCRLALTRMSVSPHDACFVSMIDPISAGRHSDR